MESVWLGVRLAAVAGIDVAGFQIGNRNWNIISEGQKHGRKKPGSVVGWKGHQRRQEWSWCRNRVQLRTGRQELPRAGVVISVNRGCIGNQEWLQQWMESTQDRYGSKPNICCFMQDLNREWTGSLQARCVRTGS